MVRQMGRIVVVALVLIVLGLPGVARAQTNWLDAEAPLAGWNVAGSTLPRAVPMRDNNPDCGAGARRADTPEDAALMAAGWTLYHGYQAGYGVLVIWALSGYDGMCRPMGYQAFVFAEGQFAGTVSPTPMNSRTDGAMSEVHFYNPALISARFLRYAPTDALCCPSLPAVTVSYRVERPAGGPLLVPFHSTVEDPR